MTDETADFLKSTVITLIVLFLVVIVMLVWVLSERRAHARNLDGRYSLSDPLHNWFTSLQNQDGAYCCAEADGVELTDDDWKNDGGHYKVFFKGEWLDVPAKSAITKPNLASKPMLWPYYENGATKIRCFLPGVMM